MADDNSVTEQLAQPSASSESNAGEGSTAISDGGRIFASPLAKKIAADKGIDLAQISGSGDNGRIVQRDVENYQPTAAPKTVEVSPSTKESKAPEAIAPIH